jgi:hypothetical protein
MRSIVALLIGISTADALKSRESFTSEMEKGNAFSGWSVDGTFDVIKIKEKESWKMDVTLNSPEALIAKEVYNIRFIFGTTETKGLELFKCGWDKEKESSKGGVFSKQFTNKINHPDAFVSAD